MARLEADKIAGYYAFPPEFIPAVANLVDASATQQGKKERWGYNSFYGRYTLLDPCAGESRAIVQLGRELFGQNLRKAQQQIKFATIEMERERYEAGRKEIEFAIDATGYDSNGHYMIHADAFTVRWQKEYNQQGAAVLWLNPPYATHKIHGRLEQKFLERFTEALLPGVGLLFYIVPFHALKASASFLDREYTDIGCWRMPSPAFEKNYKQAILVARRREIPAVFEDSRVVERIKGWAADAESIPLLPEDSTNAAYHHYRLPGVLENSGFYTLEKQEIDMAGLGVATMPWMVDSPVKKSANKRGTHAVQKYMAGLTPLKEAGFHMGLESFTERSFPVAMPPRIAHIASAMAAGMFNGKEIQPDDPASGLPPIIIRGVFEREYVTIEEKKNTKGEVKSLIQVQQPALSVNVRDMDTMVAHELQSGSEVTGSVELSKMTAADLLRHYGQSLALLMSQQFPAMHDPFNPEHQISLPVFPRKPFREQHQVIQAAIKLLYLQNSAMVLGEVGTGKSTIAMQIIGSYNSANFQKTLKKLKEINLDEFLEGQASTHRRELQPMDKALIMCPPHLLSGWTDQVGFTLPGARVIVIRDIPDLFRSTAAELASVNPKQCDDEVLAKRAQRYQQKRGQAGYGMTVYVMSRETAKLSHEYGPGVWLGAPHKKTVLVRDDNDNLVPEEVTVRRAMCPRCGGRITEELDKIVSRHLYCTNAPSRPRNRAGEIAVKLGGLLAKAAPGHANVIHMVRDQHYLSQALEHYLRRLNHDVSKLVVEEEERSGIGKANRLELEEQVAASYWQEINPNQVVRLAWEIEGYLEKRLYFYLETGQQRGGYTDGRDDITLLSEALAALVTSLPVELRRQEGLTIIRKLYRYTHEVSFVVNHEETGLPLSVRNMQDGYSKGQIVRSKLLQLALLCVPASAPRAEFAEIYQELKAINHWSAAFSQLERTRSRLESQHRDYQMVKTGSLSREEVFRRWEQSRYYDNTELDVDLASGDYRYERGAGGTHAPALLALDKLVAVGDFKPGEMCGEPLFTATPLSRNYEPGYENNEPRADQFRDYDWDWAGLGAYVGWHRKEKDGKPYNPNYFDKISHLIGSYTETRPAATNNGKERYSSTRYSVAKYITRFLPDFFDVLICDELHEYNNASSGSAQGMAFTRLAGLNKPVIGLTGSLMGGYASSLFSSAYALFDTFRSEFGRDQKSDFVYRYGYLKREVEIKSDDDDDDIEYGSMSDRRSSRKVKNKGEAPGIHPLFTVQYLLRYALFIHKEDLDEALPPHAEYPVPIDFDEDNTLDMQLQANYRELEKKLMEEIKQNMFTPGKAGKLWGAMAELMSALDLCHQETGNCEVTNKNGTKRRAYQVRYPDTVDKKTGQVKQGELVCEMPLLPNSYITPKEKWLLKTIKEQLGQERPVMVFLRHTGNGNLVRRLMRLVKEQLPGMSDILEKNGTITSKIAYLDSGKVPTATRETWINEQVVKKGIKVLFVNPITVQTGLNNLVYFPTVIWYESTYIAYVYRQANGRVHRIGQAQPVDIFAQYYAGTTQEIAVDLLSRKVTASLQVDGLSIEGALQAAGAGSSDAEAYMEKVSAQSIGRAIFEILNKQKQGVAA